jgi:hypothetical protein
VPRQRSVALIAGALGLVSGCYRYDPLTTPSPALGTYVAVTLSDGGSEELARTLGPNAFVVRGRVLTSGDPGLLVSVASVETKRGDAMPWQGEAVLLPGDAVASIEVRWLAKGRTMLLAGVGAGGLIATTLAFSLLGSSSPTGLGGGGRNGKQ